MLKFKRKFRRQRVNWEGELSGYAENPDNCIFLWKWGTLAVWISAVTIYSMYLLTSSIEQSPSWEANRFAAGQEIPHILCNPKVRYCIHQFLLSSVICYGAFCLHVVECVWNMMVHGDARELEVKGKVANGVGTQYASHFLGTWCIQHYYRWCAHLDCQ